MSWLIRLIKGVIIALGFILPGVSGGVLAAILGIYERMLSFLAHIRRNFKADFSISCLSGLVAF
jgi:putative membrane protein